MPIIIIDHIEQCRTIRFNDDHRVCVGRFAKKCEEPNANGFSSQSTKPEPRFPYVSSAFAVWQIQKQFILFSFRTFMCGNWNGKYQSQSLRFAGFVPADESRTYARPKWNSAHTLDWSCTHRRRERCKGPRAQANVAHFFTTSPIISFSCLAQPNIRRGRSMCISPVQDRSVIFFFRFFLDFRWDTLNYLILCKTII